MRIFSVTDNREIIETYLYRINTGVRVIYLIIILSVIITICLLPFIYVDISVQARGFLQPEIEKQTLFAPAGGKVIYSSIKSGSTVEKGDTLIIIDSETIRAQKESLMQRISENNTSLSDLRILTAVCPETFSSNVPVLKTDRYITEFEDVKRQYSIQYQKFTKSEKDHKRNTILFKDNLIPLSEFELSGYTYDIEKGNLDRVLTTSIGKWYYELNQRKIDSIKMSAELDHYNEELRIRIITAPVSGEIVVSSDLQPGGLVIPNQKVVDISPGGAMMANIFIKPADIGFVRNGQPVKIQVDAFNFNEWGLLEGEITDVSDDLYIEDETNPFFRAKCLLKGSTLRLKNGYVAEMRKGMSINARIRVTRRSIFNLFFDNVSEWLNPYMNNTKEK